MGGEAVRDGIAVGTVAGQLMERAGDVAVALHRLERGQHRQRIGQPFVRRIEADLRRHAARQARQVEREEFVQVDGFEQAVVERLQHLGRNQRDAEGALARLQVVDGAGHFAGPAASARISPAGS